MRTEFVYSLAALAAFPMIANANINATDWKAMTAQKDKPATAKVTLAKGSYVLLTDGNIAGTTGHKLTLTVKAGASTLKEATVDVGKAPEKFTFDIASDGTEIELIGAVSGDKDIVFTPVVQLVYDFAPIYNKLSIEYNKLTEVLAVYSYKTVQEDITESSKYYDRLQKIGEPTYKYYASNDADAVELRDGKAYNELTLYSDITTKFNTTQGEEYKYYTGGGNGVLDKLNTRFSDLEVAPNYTTDALKAAKKAANDALTTWNATPTKANHDALTQAVAAYDDALKAREAVKTANDKALSDLQKELASVYGAVDSYYAKTLQTIEAQYKDPEGALSKDRYEELQDELVIALNGIVTGKDYTDVVEKINASFNKLKAADDKNSLTNEIALFKQKLTQKVADFNALFDQLTAAYDVYDEQQTAANELLDKSPADLDPQKAAVEAAVAGLLKFIQDNDKEATIANLTEANLNAKVKDITDATKAYNDRKALYNDYNSIRGAVSDQQKDLDAKQTAADKYATDAKKDGGKALDAAFKPSVVWQTTYDAITADINTLLNKVDDRKWDAKKYKDEYKVDGKLEYNTLLQAIKDAITAYNNNVKEATDMSATIRDQIATANDLKDALNSKDKDPKVDLTTYDVWTNQVTTDDAIKARTPYNKVINTDAASAITTWTNNLNAAPGKTGKYVSDPKSADYANNILGYLKSIAATPANVLASEISTMNAIKTNYTSDEAAFKAQMEAQAIAGLKTMINAKAAALEADIDVLQKNIDGKKYGLVKGAELQKELDAITAKINVAKDKAKDDSNATKAELNEQYDIVSGLSADVATAQTHAGTYKDAYDVFVTRYNTLNGTKDDTSDKSTVYGLTKKVTEQKAVIDGKGKLSAAQKTQFKSDVDNVKFENDEKDKDNKDIKVTYTISNISTFITTALETEALTEAEVTKYQGIIEGLKGATGTPVTQADRMNTLETQLAAVDFNTAKKNTLDAKTGDPNTSGFYYVLLTGNEKKGQYTYDFNALKAKIEADKDITSAEVTSYGNDITEIKTNVEGVAAKAKANLDWFNNQKNYNAATKNHKYTDKEQFYGLDQAIAELSKDDYKTSAQAAQLTTLNGFYDKITAQETATKGVYDNGTYNEAKGGVKVADDNTALRNDIQTFLTDCINPVNVNAQIAADNDVIKAAITDAHNEANAAYKTASDIINAYKNLQSAEMADASDKAQAEKDALVEELFQFDTKAAKIQDDADKEYGQTVSPDHFDPEETYKAKFEALTKTVNDLKDAFVNKIKSYTDANVAASVVKYDTAINNSKAKVKKFSTGKDDLDDKTIKGYYTTIDLMLANITDADADDVKGLDNALLAAGNEATGIEASIVALEQDKAVDALKTLRAAVNPANLKNTAEELQKYNKISDRIDLADAGTDAKKKAAERAKLVEEFTTVKADLVALKGVAEQNAKDNTAIANAQTAINNANTALTAAYNAYDDYVAGAEVKADLDAIKANLANYPASGVTVANSAEWKAAAEGISNDVAAFYGTLYDAEVPAIEALIIKAKEEQLTYAADPKNADAADKKADITTQENNLKAVKEAVSKAAADKKLSTKTAKMGDLKNIQNSLNTTIAAMQTVNGTNTNAEVAEALTAEKDDLQKALNNSLKGYTSENVGGAKNWTALNNDKDAIQAEITALDTYITENAANMTVYEAIADEKIADINNALAALKTKAAQMKAAKDAADEAAAQKVLAGTWKSVDDMVVAAYDKVAKMKAELEAYGSASKYANKVSKLDAQAEGAEDIYTEQYALAETKDKIADKQKIATAALGSVTTQLDGLNDNCNDIVALAKNVYIADAVDAMRTELVAIDWNAENYTNTDNATLLAKWNAIDAAIDKCEADAKGQDKAEPTYKDGKIVKGQEGVKLILANGKKDFDAAVKELKQLLKDMSLEEEIKGHITGGETIEPEDIMALTDIIANGQEAAQDLERCDVNGDGHISVTDIIWLQYFWAFNEWPEVPAAVRAESNATSDAVKLQVVSTNGNITRVAVNLNNEDSYRAFQIGMQLPAGAKIVGQSFGERVVDGYLMHSESANGSARFMTISSVDKSFAGNEGAVLYVDIENLNGGVTLTEAYFTNTAFGEADLLNGDEATGIRETIANAWDSATQKFYDVSGRMLNSLKNGINIIRNADGTSTKVLKK